MRERNLGHRPGSVNLFLQLADRLVDQGWSPLVLAGKNPAPSGKGWQRFARRLPDGGEMAELAAAASRVSASVLCVGIALPPGVVALDCDIDDPALADAAWQRAVHLCGTTPARRWGRAPRWVGLWRLTDDGVLSTTRAHPLEVLVGGSGVQIAAFGPHPAGGGIEYQWAPGGSPLEVTPDELPLCKASAAIAWIPAESRRRVAQPHGATGAVRDDCPAGPWNAGVVGRTLELAGQVRGVVSPDRAGVYCPIGQHDAGTWSSTVAFGPRQYEEGPLPGRVPWGALWCSHAKCGGKTGIDRTIEVLGAKWPLALEQAWGELVDADGEDADGGAGSGEISD